MVELGIDRDVLLVEYQEICASRRHDDVSKWTVVALVFAGSSATVAWTASNFPNLVWLALLIAGTLVWVGTKSFEQTRAAYKIRMSRCSEIEEVLSMDHHRRIQKHSGLTYRGELPYPAGLTAQLLWCAKALATTLFIAAPIMGVATLLVTA